MFTGLVEDIGVVSTFSPRGAVIQLGIDTTLDTSEIKLGDSVAIDGVCLTVTKIGSHALFFDVGPESLRVTALDGIQIGRRVHMERALRLADRLGGHLVQGHVDGIGVLRTRKETGDTLELGFHAPPSILKYCIPKGSICLSGVSLTINSLHEDGFDVWLIPHTLEKTHLGELRIGDKINVESDLVGKYIERFLTVGAVGESDASPGSKITMGFLAQNGFLGGGSHQ